MAYTIKTGAGANVPGGTNPQPRYPLSGMGQGALAFLLTAVKNDDIGVLTPPSGWALRGNAPSAGSGADFRMRR